MKWRHDFLANVCWLKVIAVNQSELFVVISFKDSSSAQRTIR